MILEKGYGQDYLFDFHEGKIKNGAKGGRPSNKDKQKETKTKPKHNLDISKTKANVNDNVNVNDNYNVNDNVNSNENNNVNKQEILKMTGKSIEEVLQSDFSIEDKHKILTIRMMRVSNYNLNDKEKYKSCLNTVKKRYLNTNLL